MWYYAETRIIPVCYVTLPKDMTNMVDEFDGFRHNSLPMGMCTYRYIFQPKVNKLLGDIQVVKTNINNILVLSKYNFQTHMYHLRVILYRLMCLGLKFNAIKFILGLNKFLT